MRSGCWGEQQFITSLEAPGFDASGQNTAVVEFVDILQGASASGRSIGDSGSSNSASVSITLGPSYQLIRSDALATLSPSRAEIGITRRACTPMPSR